MGNRRLYILLIPLAALASYALANVVKSVARESTAEVANVLSPEALLSVPPPLSPDSHSTSDPPGRPAPPPVTITHTVGQGDAFVGIGKRVGTDSVRVARTDGIAEADRLHGEQALAIPPSLRGGGAVPRSTPRPTARPPHREVIGHSVEGRAIEAFWFGRGSGRVVFVGGIHGGYEWNTILLAYEMMDYLAAHPEAIPASLSVVVIPSANPDGQFRVVGRDGRFSPADVPAATAPGRFNAHGVDLNRNWDCEWSPSAVWRQKPISGGSAPFSEVESQALRDFLLTRPARAVVFWHSAMPGVIPGDCGDALPLSRALAAAYAQRSGYPLQASFTGYRVTGDASDWLSKVSIPAISVELSDHVDTETERNVAGAFALLKLLEGD